ncbi:hypothetical protein ACFZC6_27755 [Streptomyces ossamyceticus]|uniref:hypothetical protein n=1 Tax=Streptomyces ossamyceticus TaxID=249581 RepID=UPI0036E60B45
MAYEPLAQRLRSDTDLVAELRDRLRDTVRRVEGWDPEPSAGVVDSQSVKADATITQVSRGFDAGKKLNGRKRHLVTSDRDRAITHRLGPVIREGGGDATPGQGMWTAGGARLSGCHVRRVIVRSPPR